MSADFTFDPGLVFDDTTMTTAKNATGVLRDVAGGSVQPVYDLLGNPISGLSTNEYGYVGRFKADIGKGVLDFGSITQPVFSWDYFNAASIGAGSPSGSGGVLSSVRAEAAGFTLFENVGGQGYSYINPTGWTFGPLETGAQTGMVDTADGSMATTVEGWYTGRFNVQMGWPTTGPDWVFPSFSTYNENLNTRPPIPQLPPYGGLVGHSLKGIQASFAIQPFYSPAYVSGGGTIGALLEWAGSYGSPVGPNNTPKPYLRIDLYRIG